MTVFTQSNALSSTEPMKVARSLLSTRFRTPQGHQGLWVWRGNVLEWFGGQWHVRDNEWIESAVWLALEDAEYTVQTSTGTEVRRFAPTPHKVQGVIDALRQVARLPWKQLPVWTREGDTLDAGRTMTFRNMVVDVRDLKPVPRDETWIQTMVLPVDLDPASECPTWMRCLDQWSNSDDDWKALVQRMFGYCLTGHSLYAKWFLLHGKVRGGKGTMMGVLKKLLGGAFASMSLEDLARPFGLWGLERSKVLSIGEVAEIRGSEAETACRVLKQIVGRDPLVIDVKYREPLRDVVVDAIPIMQANEIPRLPNKGMGLSSKMVPIPFRVSFLGREDHLLSQKLDEELPGIAAWALQGAHDLEMEANPAQRFPLTEEGHSIIEDYATANNPVDDFLETHFEPSPNQFVASSVIGERWNRWCEATGGRRMPLRSLIQHLREHGSWELRKHRLGAGGPRGIVGLKLKPLPESASGR